jgi:hypothetical protein
LPLTHLLHQPQWLRQLPQHLLLLRNIRKLRPSLSKARQLSLPRKPKLLRSNPHRLTAIVINGENPSDVVVDDEDVYVAYRRRDIEKDLTVYKPDDALPNDIEWKLFLARQVALIKYREVHGQERA